MAELNANGIKIYQFPTEDDTVAEINTSMNTHIPFAIVGSTEFARVGNKMVRARQYPWGTVQGTLFVSCLFYTANIEKHSISLQLKTTRIAISSSCVKC